MRKQMILLLIFFLPNLIFGSQLQLETLVERGAGESSQLTRPLPENAPLTLMREAGRVLATGSIWDSELDLADEPRIPVWASLLLVSLGGLSVLALGGVLVLR
ncbi:MAG: hypothetical protein PVI59_11005, partial [Anaerolineae bacterium]